MAIDRAEMQLRQAREQQEREWEEREKAEKLRVEQIRDGWAARHREEIEMEEAELRGEKYDPGRELHPSRYYLPSEREEEGRAEEVERAEEDREERTEQLRSEDREREEDRGPEGHEAVEKRESEAGRVLRESREDRSVELEQPEEAPDPAALAGDLGREEQDQARAQETEQAMRESEAGRAMREGHEREREQALER